MEKIKIGIIGLGMGFDRLHLPALKRLTDKYEIVSICDVDKERLDLYKVELNIEDKLAYSDYNEMLKNKDIEAVLTIVPIEENFETAKAVISTGKHLLAEKPFAKSVESAKILLTLAERQKIKVLVAENFRYHEELKIIKKIIDDKTIGEPVYFIDNNIYDFNEDKKKDTFSSRDWRQHPSFIGGTFLDAGVHHIAKYRYLFGNVDKLCAFGQKLDNLDTAEFSSINALLKFSNKVTGHYSFYNIGKETQAPLVGFRIFFTEGEIYLEDKNCGFINLTYKDNRHELISYKTGEGYYNEWLNLYEAIKEDKKIESTMEKEIGDMVVLFEILESMENNAK
ncbi:MAG: Gfo/Idh/MocA family protein [Lachnospirales bacterium]